MEKMSIIESLSTSLMGIGTVFLVLVSLAILIKIVTWVLSLLKMDVATSTPSVMPKKEIKKSEVVEDDLYAAIIAAISAEIKLPINSFRIVTINEKK